VGTLKGQGLEYPINPNDATSLVPFLAL